MDTNINENLEEEEEIFIIPKKLKNLNPKNY